MNFCAICGQPLDPVTKRCPVCGDDAALCNSDGFVDSLKNNLSSSLMLIMCIVMSVSALTSFSILTILTVVSLWMIYYHAKSSGPMNLSGIKMASTVITITRVITWIAIVLLVIFGILMLMAPFIFPGVIYSFTELTQSPTDYEANMTLSFFAIIFGILFLVLAVLYAIVNIFFYGCVSKSIKSVIESFEKRENHLKKFKAVMIWQIIFGSIIVVCLPNAIYSAFFSSSIIESSTLSSLNAFSLFSQVLSVIVYIIGAILAYRIDSIKSENQIFPM